MENYYLWFKAIHLISAICWMIGLLYLPRIYVYHTRAKIGGEADKMLQIMELKLMRVTMNPAMISTFIFGIINAYIYGIVALGAWFHVKMLVIIILVIFHGLLARWRKDFANGKNTHSEKFYRILNEVPTICMVVAVTMVIVKPFE